MTSDILVPGPQKSMYLRAARLNIPKWLVDMRHTISHAQDLPNLESLRAAVGYILEWIFVRNNWRNIVISYPWNVTFIMWSFQIKYWNIDDNFVIVGKKLHMNVVDEFIELLEFYVLSKSQISSDFKEKQLNVLR